MKKGLFFAFMMCIGLMMSAQGTMTLTDSVLQVGKTLNFKYTGGTGAATDWVGIYTENEIPDGTPPSLQWHYIKTPAATDSIKLVYIDGGKPIVSGKYKIHLFCCDGYKSLASATFSIVGATPASMDITAYAKEGSDITFKYAGGTGDTTDWIGIYRPNGVPGTDASLAFEYIKTSSGSVTFKKPGLPAGDYIARMFCCDGYNVLTSFNLKIAPNLPPSLAPVGKLEVGKPLIFKYTGGTGDFDDWIGFYLKDSIPDGRYIAFEYVNAVNGEFTFAANTLKPGIAYDAHFFCCNVYNKVIASYKNFTLATTVAASNAIKSTQLFTANPSPAMEIVRIKFDKNSTGQFTFYNMAGQTVRQIPVVNTNTLEVRNLPSGSYIGRFVGKEGSQSKKIIVLDY